MELRQLEYFVAVAEEANFTRAAERVHISQSGVSAQIRQLEHELGIELIDRSGRTATLTTAGEAALEHARAALASAAALQQSIDEVNGILRGQLVVGMVIGCTVLPLFEGLSRFHQAHPKIALTLIEDNSDRLIEGVRAGRVDLALIGTATATPPGLNAFTIISERLAVLAPSGHPLLALTEVRLEHLSGHPLICMPQGTGIRTVFDIACARQGLKPSIALQASAAESIVELAARGLGVAILSESMATHYVDRTESRLIADAENPALLALVWGPKESPALRALVSHCQAAFA